ncbi:Uncharacterised protein [Halioglobus japonicus]|nr:Uncharacterised protein [Halioglobus japonicus]
MRAVVLAAVFFSFSCVAMGGTELTVAQKKKALAENAREAAKNLDEHASYTVLLQPMPQHKLQASEAEPFILLDSGWSAVTEGGVWSVGNSSSLYFRLGEGERPRHLLIQGAYFNGTEPTRLFVNGELLSEVALENVTVDLPSGLDESTPVHIELQHLNPVAPSDLKPGSRDTRKLKFRLEQIRVW